MLKTLLTALSLLTLTVTYGQKTEIGLSLNSGLFWFRGASAEAVSSINYDEATNDGYTNNPYGSKPGLCIGLSGNIQHISRSNFIIGIGLGYEILSSGVAIHKIDGYANHTTYSYSAHGRTSLNYGFINTRPFLGYRLKIYRVSLDMTGGLDICYCLSTRESGHATDANGKKYKTALDRKTITADLRPRIQVNANYGKAGIYVGYSYGFANYQSGYVGGVNMCFANIFRFGLTYRFH